MASRRLKEPRAKRANQTLTVIIFVLMILADGALVWSRKAAA